MSQVDVAADFFVKLDDVKKELEGLQNYIKGWGESVKQLGVAAFAAWVSNKAFNTIKSLFADARGAIVGWIEAASEAEEVDKRLDIAVRNAGKSVGYTADQLREQANALEMTSIFGDEAIKTAQTALIRYNLVGDTFKRTTEAAVAMASVQKTDVVGSAELLGRALAYPERAMFMLRRAGIALTEEQKASIQSFIKQGETAKAQSAILDAIQQKYGGTAKELANTYSGISAQLANFAGDVEEALGAPIMELLKTVRPTIRILVYHVKDLAEAFGEWIKTLTGSDTAKSSVDALNDALLKLFSYLEAAIKRLPSMLKVLFAYIKYEIADIKQAIFGVVAGMPVWMGGGTLGGAYKSQVGAIQERGVAARDYKDASDALNARGTFWEEAATIEEQIRNRGREMEKAGTSPAFGTRPMEVYRQSLPDLLDLFGLANPMIPQGKVSGIQFPMAGGGSDFLTQSMSSVLSMAAEQSATMAKNLNALSQAAKEPDEDKKGFKSAIESATSTFQRIQSAAAGTPDVPKKTLDAMTQLLLEVKKNNAKESDRDAIWKKIADQGLPAVAS